jgi:biotin operon repressor
MSLDAAILTAFRRAGSGFVSGADLSQRLGVIRAAIWARVDDRNTLRTVGSELRTT